MNMNMYKNMYMNMNIYMNMIMNINIDMNMKKKKIRTLIRKRKRTETGTRTGKGQGQRHKQEHCGEPAISLHSHHVSLVQWTTCLLPVTRDSGSNPLGATYVKPGFSC